MTLPAFTVTAHVSTVTGATTTSLPTGTQIAFTTNLANQGFVIYSGELLLVEPVPAVFDTSGNLQLAGGGEVELLANDPGLNVTALQWSVSVTDPTGRLLVAPWWFNAPTTGDTIDLATVAQAPAVVAQAAAAGGATVWWDGVGPPTTVPGAKAGDYYLDTASGLAYLLS